MKRLFLAIDISDEARRVAAAHITELKREFPRVRASWVRPENLHITLKFLGDTDEALAGPVCEALAEAAASWKPFTLEIEETAAFGRRVLSLLVKDETGSLSALKNALDIKLGDLGFETEKRRFTPHLTIVRIRSRKGAGPLIERHIMAKFEPVRLNVSSVALYESSLLPAGSQYTRLLDAVFADHMPGL
jgi:RNA 2',3'-cyclic 3'-phosphodiesterase